MLEIELWRVIAEHLAADRAVVLAAVAASRGSSPGKAGALMAVAADRPLAGTVGGGAAESQALEVAWQMLAKRQPPALALYQRLHAENNRAYAPAPPAMLCGGEQQLVLALLLPDTLERINTLIGQLAAGRGASWQITPAGWSADVIGSHNGWQQAGEHWYYVHQAGQQCEAWLIGGGHVSQALSAVLRPLDFHVVVAEERPGIGSFLDNPHAHRKLAMSYEQLTQQLPSGRNCFVAIMTHSWQCDAWLVHQLAGRRFGYLGLLGSRHKIARVCADLPPAEFIHAPMGLPIGSHTPEEIAISIAAEMIAVRAALRA